MSARLLISAGAICALAITVGCPGRPPPPSEVPHARLSISSPVVLGGDVHEYPLLVCGTQGVICNEHALQAVSATADDPAVIEILEALIQDPWQARIHLRALAPGQTTVRVVLTDDKGTAHSAQGDVQVLAPTRVELRPTCSAADASEPYLFPVSSRIELTYGVYAGETLLHGYWSAPFDAGAIVPLSTSTGRAVFRTPPAPGLNAITTPADPALHLEIQTYNLASIDTVDVRVAPGGGSDPHVVTDPPSAIPIELEYGVGGRRVCGKMGEGFDGEWDSPERFGVSFTSRASGPCALAADGGTALESRSARRQVYGRSEGFCGVRAGVDGGPGWGFTGVWFKSPLPRVPGSWTWENPTPQGDTVTAMGGTGPGDLWAATSEGALLHWDGGTWTATSTGMDVILLAVWSAAPDDAWACGTSGALFHWDGARWTQVHSGAAVNLNGLWGTSGQDVWAVGQSGTILHYDGSAWTKVASGTKADLRSIWGSGDDIWIGSSTGVLRWNGSTWVEALAGADGGFLVNGSASDDVWAAGNTIARWNGAAWTPVATDAGQLKALHVATRDRAWAVGELGIYRWDGASWALSGSPGGSPTPLRVIREVAADDVWAAGSLGEMARWDGLSWNMVSGGISGAGRWLNDVWGSSADDLWAVGVEYAPGTGQASGVILRRGTAGWASVATTFDPLRAVWGTGPSDVWAAGDYGMVVHFDGASWTPVPSGTTKHLRAIWGTGPNDVWIVGAQSVLLRWDGRAFAKSLVGHCDILGCGDSDHSVIWGTSANDVWVGGTTSWTDWGLWHWNGWLWTEQRPTVAGKRGAVHGIWGSGPNDVWVNAGALVHWDGVGWTKVFTGYPVGDLLGFGPDDVWAGNLHWDGASWTIVESPSPLGPLWGTDSNHLWTVGTNAKVMRYGP